ARSETRAAHAARRAHARVSRVALRAGVVCTDALDATVGAAGALTIHDALHARRHAAVVAVQTERTRGYARAIAVEVAGRRAHAGDRGVGRRAELSRGAAVVARSRVATVDATRERRVADAARHRAAAVTV